MELNTEPGQNFTSGAPVVLSPLLAGEDISTLLSRTLAGTAAHFAWLAGFFAFDLPASSTKTRERLGWRPHQPGLIADLERGRYFEI